MLCIRTAFATPLPLFTVALLVAVACRPTESTAKVIFETASLGPTGVTSGYLVAPDNFLAVRFEITSSVTTTAIGGHFSYLDGDPNSQFGAIVALADANDFPDSPLLSTADVLGTTLYSFPYPSADVAAPLSLNLNPGHYALVFGSGLFGATSEGVATQNNNAIGDPSWFGYRPSQGWFNANLDGVRFFIEAVPEPNALALFAIGMLYAVVVRGRPSKCAK